MHIDAAVPQVTCSAFTELRVTNKRNRLFHNIDREVLSGAIGERCNFFPRPDVSSSAELPKPLRPCEGRKDRVGDSPQTVNKGSPCRAVSTLRCERRSTNCISVQLVRS
ncbi:hypothetical protein J6590_055514 [Homalodisca vitripennis]|nr:hypothetical protein J6590_055514 [Homalodisca vitripennis]